MLTTGNMTSITTTGTVTSGSWTATSIADGYVDNDLTIVGGTVNNSVIGASTPAAGTFTSITGTGLDMNGNADVSGTTALVGEVTVNAGIIPDAEDGAYLGTSSAEFSDLFMADGAVLPNGNVIKTAKGQMYSLAPKDVPSKYGSEVPIDNHGI